MDEKNFRIQNVKMKKDKGTAGAVCTAAPSVGFYFSILRKEKQRKSIILQDMEQREGQTISLFFFNISEIIFWV